MIKYISEIQDFRLNFEEAVSVFIAGSCLVAVVAVEVRVQCLDSKFMKLKYICGVK